MFKALFKRKKVIAPPSPTYRSIEAIVAACVPVPRMDDAGSRRAKAKLSHPVHPAASTLLLGDSLLAYWPPKKEVHNLAIGGDRVQNTLWMLCNLSDDVAEFSFSRIIVLVGTNNISRRFGAAAITAGLRILWSMVRERWPDAEIIAMTIPYRCDVNANDDVRCRVNGWIISNSSMVSSVINTDEVLSSVEDPLLEDRLHLTEAAYAQLTGAIL